MLNNNSSYLRLAFAEQIECGFNLNPQSEMKIEQILG